MEYTEIAKIEGVRVEKERLIHGRYLLQRPLAQGQVCAIFKGFDHVLQRSVVVKLVPTPHIASYRDAVKLTAEFSHPNIVGIYDMIEEPETLYIVQEYVEGDSFGTLLQTQLSPYQVADAGTQICHALLYASVREVCHGDLTPSAVMRDKRGLIRLNSFALPGDLSYFTAWSAVGGNGTVLSDPALPWGKVSSGRSADDVRAVGLLLYQLLAGRAPGTTTVEPPIDGRLRFLRNVPIELCELIARAVVRQHPQHLTTVEPLYVALQELMETLAPSDENAANNFYQTDDMAKFNQATIANGGAERLVTSLPVREGNQAALLSYRNDAPGTPAINYPQPAMLPGTSTPVATSVDPPVKLVSAQDVYTEQPIQQSKSPMYQNYQESPPHRLSLPILVTLGIVLFVLFFVVGYFVAHIVIP